MASPEYPIILLQGISLLEFDRYPADRNGPRMILPRFCNVNAILEGGEALA